MKRLILLTFLLFTVFLQAQLKNYADCEKAQNLNTEKNEKIGIFPSPQGYGKVMEINDAKKSNYYFEKEHHTSWFKFDVTTANKFSFEIIPQSPQDDYDFILFKIDSKINACEQIRLKKIKPIRTNIAKGDSTFKGKTGLTLNAQNNFQSSGKGKPYSSYIDVLPNETYYLVIDKYEASKGGFTINLNYQKDILIKGVIVDDSKKSIKAEVSLSNEQGQEVFKTTTDEKGNYEMKTALNVNENYFILAYSDSNFIDTKTINTNELKQNKNTFQDITLVLPKLKKGKKYLVKNINFMPESDMLLSESLPIQENLFKLMSKNKKLKIVIEGHVNGPNLPNNDIFKELSRKRALRISNFLISSGIDKDRISNEWFGNSKMLFPSTKDEAEMILNRRVEIKVVDF